MKQTRLQMLQERCLLQNKIIATLRSSVVLQQETIESLESCVSALEELLRLKGEQAKARARPRSWPLSSVPSDDEDAALAAEGHGSTKWG